MPIIVTCACGKQFQTKDENAGRRARCPDCGRELIIPGAGAAGELGGDFEAGPAKGFVPRTSGKAIASLVLGVFSLVCTIFTGIPAVILGALGLMDIERSHGLRTGKGMAIAGIVLGSLGSTLIMVALLLPAVQAAREAARRSQCVNNLKQIGLAMHNYHSTYNTFPPAATTSPDGKPLMSWRVLLLPFIESNPLYAQLHLDEPWDSPHNKPLLAQVPRVFACPSSPAASRDGSDLTTYQVLIGPGTLFETQEGTPISTITDGTSNTLMVVESITPVPWAQPSALPYTPKAPVAGLGSDHPGGFNALFADGAVRFLKQSVAPATLDALITRDGGEVISSDSF